MSLHGRQIQTGTIPLAALAESVSSPPTPTVWDEYAAYTVGDRVSYYGQTYEAADDVSAVSGTSIAFVGTAVGGTASGGDSTLTLPSGTAADDTAVLVAAFYGANNPSAPTGWTQRLSFDGTGGLNEVRVRVYTRVVTSGEVSTGSYTVNDAAFGGSAMVMRVYRNVHATPVDVSDTYDYGSAQTSLTAYPLPVTTTAAGEIAIALVGMMATSNYSANQTYTATPDNPQVRLVNNKGLVTYDIPAASAGATATTPGVNLSIPSSSVAKGTVALKVGTGSSPGNPNPAATPAVWTVVDSSALVGSMPTASRPSAADHDGRYYFDTTLNKPAWSDGTNWRDATGTTV